MSKFSSALTTFLHESNPWWYGKKLVFPTKRWVYYELKDVIMNSKEAKALLLLGSRRTGKTVLLYQLAMDLIEEGYSVLYVPVDELVVRDIGTIINAVDLYLKSERNQSRAVILLDEVQFYERWSLEVKTLIDKFNRKNEDIKIVCTGSSALGLTIGAGEALIGRASIYRIYPMSVIETTSMVNREPNLSEYIWRKRKSIVEDISRGNLSSVVRRLYMDLGVTTINKIMKNLKLALSIGGLPEIIDLYNRGADYTELVKKVNEIIDLVVLRDILRIQRLYPTNYKIEPEEAYKIIKLLLFNTPLITSYNNLSNEIGVNRQKIKLAINLMKYASIMGVAQPYSKTQMITSRKRKFKIFAMDNGLRNLTKGLTWKTITSNTEELGRTLENFVLSRTLPILNAMGYNMPTPHYWEIRKGKNTYEVDAIIKTYNETIAIETKTTRRTSKSLNQIKKYDKNIIVHEAILEEPESLLPLLII